MPGIQRIGPALALVTLVSILSASCNQKGEGTTDKAPAPAEKPAGCTFEAPLVAGVPGSPGNLLQSTVNPNGDSQLGLLMRTMRTDMLAAREAIMKDERPKALADTHRKILCTWPTDPKVRTPLFGIMADDYVKALESMGDPKQNARDAYTSALTKCVGCHEKSCPGPIQAISAMHLPGPDGVVPPAPTDLPTCEEADGSQ